MDPQFCPNCGIEADDYFNTLNNPLKMCRDCHNVYLEIEKIHTAHAKKIEPCRFGKYKMFCNKCNRYF